MKTVKTFAFLAAFAFVATAANASGEREQNYFYYFGGPVAAAPCANPCAPVCAPVCPPVCEPVCPPPCPCPCPPIRGIFW